jgi:hypothetical protein
MIRKGVGNTKGWECHERSKMIRKHVRMQTERGKGRWRGFWAPIFLTRFLDAQVKTRRKCSQKRRCSIARPPISNDPLQSLTLLPTRELKAEKMSGKKVQRHRRNNGHCPACTRAKAPCPTGETQQTKDERDETLVHKRMQNVQGSMYSFQKLRIMVNYHPFSETFSSVFWDLLIHLGAIPIVCL